MNKSEIIQDFIEAVFNRGDLSKIQKIIHPNYSYTSPTERMDGPEALSGFVQAFRVSFPDLHVKVLDQETGELSVFTRIRVTGTHRGEFMGMPATQKAIDIEGCVLSKFKDDLVHEEWELLDNLTLLQQLGATA